VIQFRRASPSETGVVAGVLTAAATRLAEKGIPLWTTAEVSEAAIAKHVQDGMYHLALEADQPVGVFRLQRTDPWFWPEIAEGTSLFLHKLAVLPAQQGRGFAHRLLEHACELAREDGRAYLRLDCMGGRPKLSAVYQQFGFRLHSRKEIAGHWFDRFEYPLRG
jgi:GNAT superfamily N-acetyltransferase